METIIFLEIEGVLTSYDSMKNSSSKNIYTQFGIDTNALFLLKRLTNATNGKIVMTSSLRFDDDFKKLEMALRTMGFIIIGKTEFNGYDKSLEICDYITKHNIRNYIILDSEELSETPEIKEYFIETPTDDGLQDYLVDEAIELARKSRKNKRLARRKTNVNKNTNN